MRPCRKLLLARDQTAFTHRCSPSILADRGQRPRMRMFDQDSACLLLHRSCFIISALTTIGPALTNCPAPSAAAFLSRGQWPSACAPTACWSSAACSRAGPRRRQPIAAGRVIADDVTVGKPSDEVSADARAAGGARASLGLARRGEAFRSARPFRLRSRRGGLPGCRRLDRRVHAGPACARCPAGRTQSTSATASSTPACALHAVDRDRRYRYPQARVTRSCRNRRILSRSM